MGRSRGGESHFDGRPWQPLRRKPDDRRSHCPQAEAQCARLAHRMLRGGPRCACCAVVVRRSRDRLTDHAASLLASGKYRVCESPLRTPPSSRPACCKARRKITRQVPPGPPTCVAYHPPGAAAPATARARGAELASAKARCTASCATLRVATRCSAISCSIRFPNSEVVSVMHDRIARKRPAAQPHPERLHAILLRRSTLGRQWHELLRPGAHVLAAAVKWTTKVEPSHFEGAAVVEGDGHRTRATLCR